MINRIHAFSTKMNKTKSYKEISNIEKLIFIIKYVKYE